MTDLTDAFRAAAAAMYTKAKRLAEHSHHQTDISPLELLTRECQAYLVAYNTLSLVDESQRCFEVDFDVHASSPRAVSEYQRPILTLADLLYLRQRSRQPRIFDAKPKNPKEVTLRDIERDYIISLARLQLAQHFPELVRAGEYIARPGTASADELCVVRPES